MALKQCLDELRVEQGRIVLLRGSKEGKGKAGGGVEGGERERWNPLKEN